MIVGHSTARTLLREHLAPATLIEGVAGIGKSLVAREAAEHHAEQVFAPGVPMTAAVAEAALAFLHAAPQAGDTRAVVLDLDGSSDIAQQRLLKTLERPPPHTWVVMHSSGSRLDTVASRCFRIRCYPLSQTETFRVLLSLGVSPTDADLLSRNCEGRPALGESFRAALAERGRVLGVLKAVSARNWTLVGKTLNVPWSPASVTALRLWLNEALTHEARFYRVEERFGLDRSVPRHVLQEAERRLDMLAPPPILVATTARILLGR